MSKNRRDRQAERSRQDILDAAARVFAGSGYRGATMNDIAREAEYSAPTIYSYFKKKRDILDSLMESTLAAMLAVFDEPVLPGLDLRTRMTFLLRSISRMVDARMPAVITMFKLHTDGLSDDDGPLPNAQATFLTRLTRWFAEHVQADEARYPPETLAWVLFGLFQGYELHWMMRWAPKDGQPDTGCSPPIIGSKNQEILDIFFQGIAP
ncbi:MAG: AcrR family transcriptional regulator [Bradymonadia bacterium]|jgi:AcrR family transcriptional regulator